MLGDVAITPIDAQLELKPGAYTEYDTRGNDHLTSIVLGSTVSGMPEKYAFDSCENLIDVTLGGAVKDIGKLPFRGCISLEHVKGNGYYNCENGILYGKSIQIQVRADLTRLLSAWRQETIRLISRMIRH